MMVFLLTFYFQLFDISLVSSVGCQVFINFDGDILKAPLFEQVSDRLFTDLHMFDMLQTNMDNSIFLQAVHGPKIELIDTSNMVQFSQIRLYLLDVHPFWNSIEENPERAPKTWNGF